MPKLLGDLSESELDLVVRHPAQLAARHVVYALLTELRRCDEPSEYNDFQRELFQHVHEVETRLGAIRRVCKRLARGKSVPSDAPELGNGEDPLDEHSWVMEERTYERVTRQLRSVGDALAWRVTGFDRRFILALSRNEAAGPMFGKRGLGFELGAVVELWDDRKHFALLHDLTSCLRIGDLTEFESDGSRFVREVKASGRRDPKQTARMEAALAAINDAAALPGGPEQLVTVDVAFRTHLRQMADALTMAEERGVADMKVSGGRALVATNLLMMATSDRFADRSKWVDEIARRRGAVLQRAGIDRDSHHLSMRTADWAGRSASMVPWGVYPLSPQHCADLICDFAIVEVVMSPVALLERAGRLGFAGEILLPNGHGELIGEQPMFRLSRQDRTITSHARLSGQLLAELIEIDVFLGAMDRLIDSEPLIESPVVTFRNESAVWR